jgi:hypothetical protein
MDVAFVGENDVAADPAGERAFMDYFDFAMHADFDRRARGSAAWIVVRAGNGAEKQVL